jgi:hypothetical protein
MVTKVGARPKMKVPMYEGELNVEELLDWINAMDKYFNYEDINDKNKVMNFVTRMKDLEPYGGMNYRLTEGRKERKKLGIGTGW